MASSSSSCSWRYDVFPSFSGEDVRKSLLSHLLKELHRKSINTFIDHGIERSRPIGPELLSAIRESRISIVVFSKNYASSSWCLNELVEIYKSFNELNQMVIPVFYNVDPSEVRKQTGEFGKIFEGTCNGKTEDQKQRWMQALAEVANMAGEDSRNWSDESNMIERTANDVSNKLLIIPSNDFGDFVGIEAHLEAMNSVLCLESEDVRMVGNVGPSGIGKSTIARALFSQLSSQFHYKAFVSYKRTIQDDYGMKLRWEEQFLSEILCHKEIKLFHLGAVEQRLKHKKVLIVLDDVDDIELLKTLVGQTGWFGLGSRIVVITKDKQLLRLHKIDLVYEVDYPSENLALQMFCRCSFGQNSPPDGFMKLAVEVANLAGNLPLGLNVLGSSLRRKDKEEWMELLPRLRDGLNGKIEKTLRVSYDELEYKDQEVFLYIACLLNGQKVDYIKNLLGESVGMGLRMLADKSLIRITPSRGAVNMHSLLQKLGKEQSPFTIPENGGSWWILRIYTNFLLWKFSFQGTENVLGMYFNTSELEGALFVNEESFKGMHNLTFLKVCKEWSGESGEGRLCLPRGYVYLPRKLRLLYWDEYPLTFMHFNFRAEILVKLTMENSNLEKLWEGVQSLGSLRTIDLSGCESLKEIPDLSTATNLEYLDLTDCKSLVMLPSSIRNLKKLVDLKMEGCTGLEVLPNDVNLVSLNQYFNLSGCSRLRSFPQISTSIVYLHLDYTAIEEVPSWIGNISGLSRLTMRGCKKLEKVASNSFKLKSLLEIDFSDCEGVRTFSDDASVVTSNNEGHQPVTEEATFHLGHLTASEKNCASHSFFNPVSCLKFQNCFNLDQDARKLILQSGFKHAVLPGKEVHPYFRDQACGTSLTISLHESSLSLQVLQFKACILVEPPTGYPRNRYACIGVWWYFRGTRNIHNVCIDVNPCNVAHLVVFHFDLCLPKEVNCHPSELDYNDMAFDFESKSQHRIKGCGVRLIIVSPSKDGSCTSSETQYRQQCGESDMENGRSKKRLWMALTSEKPSKLLRGEDTLVCDIHKSKFGAY
ncbi:hypothetical protein Bca52824_070987 [Brassica carinata]|uniref:ADP-ribosyl cyclase/cyclic ADP-ribose hydrolase n=1 Tax=Brassica carinata TaxID=52824 RepID=A0A8X7Q6I5_BRACI|nr:hypothetical protein Bca52824_070987 [Brassica carinata]